MDSGRFSKKGTIGMIVINNLAIIAVSTAQQPTNKVICWICLGGMIILGSIFLIVQGHSDCKNGKKAE